MLNNEFFFFRSLMIKQMRVLLTLLSQRQPHPTQLLLYRKVIRLDHLICFICWIWSIFVLHFIFKHFDSTSLDFWFKNPDKQIHKYQDNTEIEAKKWTLIMTLFIQGVLKP